MSRPEPADEALLGSGPRPRAPTHAEFVYQQQLGFTADRPYDCKSCASICCSRTSFPASVFNRFQREEVAEDCVAGSRTLSMIPHPELR